MKTTLPMFVGILGLACTSETVRPADSVPTNVSRPEPDENGVRVAGGETSDFGSGDGAPDPCRTVETEALSVEEALAQDLPIDHVLSILDEPFEAPLHWGYHCDEGVSPPGSAPDTLLSMRAELINVYRALRAPWPNEPQETICDDRYQYRAVIELSTNDGRISGRFYVRFDSIFTHGDTIVVRAAADARNFEGSLSVPVDVERPHFAAFLANFTLREDGSFGTIDFTVNYTDDGPRDVPKLYGAGGFWPPEGHLGEGGVRLPVGDGSFYNPDFAVLGFPLCAEASPIDPGAQTLSLDDYPGSAEPPTCIVEASMFGQGEYGGFTAPDYVAPETDDYAAVSAFGTIEPIVLIDGERTPVGERWGVPLSLGRYPVGTRIALETRSTDPTVMPFAALSIDGYGDTGYDQFAFCDSLGCVARVEDTVAGYCAR